MSTAVEATPAFIGGGTAGRGDSNVLAAANSGFHRPGLDHGRAPSLSMRHTIHDKLAVATQPAFLSFRAALHRNGDDCVLLSEEVTEQRLSSTSALESSVSRSLVITPSRLYLIRMPSRVLFAPCSVGACFALSDLARMCVAQSTGIHITFQFINGVVAVQCQTQREAQAILDVIFSATGIAAEALTLDEEEAARLGSTHFARPMRRLNVATLPAMHGGVGEASGSGSLRRMAPSQVHVDVSDTSVVGGAEGALRRLLTGQQHSSQDGARLPGPYDDRDTQTESVRHVDMGISCSPTTVPGLMVDRSTSPIRLHGVLLRSSEDAGGAGSVSHHRSAASAGHSSGSAAHRTQSPRSSGRTVSKGRSPNSSDPFSMRRDVGVEAEETESDRGSSTATSDFDPSTDIWRSLQGGAASSGRRSGGAKMHGASPPPAVSRIGSTVGFGKPSHGGSGSGVNDEKGSSRPASPTNNRQPQSLSSPVVGGGANDPAPAGGAVPQTSLPLSTPPGHATSRAAAATTGETSANHQTSAAAPSMQRHAQPSLDGFLGVLSGYAGAIQSRGIDAVGKLLELDDGAIDRLLDEVGVVKQGHRMLMHSKVALGRQQLRRNH